MQFRSVLLAGQVVATIFNRFMSTGRTSPALLSCIHTERNEIDDYVVKLNGGCEFGTAQLVRELAAAELADYFGISHPQQFFVQLDAEMVDAMAMQVPDRAELCRRSAGLNFGTKLLIGLATWPVDRIPSASQFDPACEIFAFDVLIDNPDRNFNNPNLGTVGDQLFIYDHELAFASVFDIFPRPEPWRIADEQSWTRHVFFNQLRRKRLALEGFAEKLSTLPEDFFAEVSDSIPLEWDQSPLAAISERMNLISNHSDEFVDELQRRLA
jgi:hypothetical protein